MNDRVSGYGLRPRIKKLCTAEYVRPWLGIASIHNFSKNNNTWCALLVEFGSRIRYSSKSIQWAVVMTVVRTITARERQSACALSLERQVGAEPEPELVRQ